MYHVWQLSVYMTLYEISKHAGVYWNKRRQKWEARSRFGKLRPQQLAKPPLHAVANHRIADLLRHRDAVANTAPVIGLHQQDETRHRHTQAAIRSEEVRARGHHVAGADGLFHDCQIAKRAPEWEPASLNAGHCGPRSNLSRRGSGAEFLAATLATRGKNLAATGGRLAGEETVATRTNEIAGLESPLHITLENLDRPTARGANRPKTLPTRKAGTSSARHYGLVAVTSRYAIRGAVSLSLSFAAGAAACGSVLASQPRMSSASSQRARA